MTEEEKTELAILVKDAEEARIAFENQKIMHMPYDPRERIPAMIAYHRAELEFSIATNKLVAFKKHFILDNTNKED